MSKQSDYDRLRADVLALRDELLRDHEYLWATVKLSRLLETHPATVEAPAPCHKKRPTIAELEAILSEDVETSIEVLPNGEVRAKVSEPSLPTPARATPKVSPMGEIMDAHRLVIARGIRRLSEKHSGISATAMELVANLVETGDLP